MICSPGAVTLAPDSTVVCAAPSSSMFPVALTAPTTSILPPPIIRLPAALTVASSSTAAAAAFTVRLPPAFTLLRINWSWLPPFIWICATVAFVAPASAELK